MVHHSCFCTSHPLRSSSHMSSSSSPTIVPRLSVERRPRPSTPPSNPSQSKILSAFKPIVSAAAAAFFLMSGRRGVTNSSSSSDGGAASPSPIPPSEDDDIQIEIHDGNGNDDDAMVVTNQPRSIDTEMNEFEKQLTTSTTAKQQQNQTKSNTSIFNQQSSSSSAKKSSTTVGDNAIIKAIRSNTSRIPRFTSPSDWDWSDIPDDASIWAATAAILGGARPRSSDDAVDEDNEDEDVKLKRRFKDTMDTLSAALRGLSDQQPFVMRSKSTSSTISSDSDFDPGSGSDTDSDTIVDDDEGDGESNDFRPLIAVTIGVTLFLLTRSPKASRRRELEAGAHDGSLVVDDDELLVPSSANSSIDYSALSDMRSGPRNIVIVTTAALPWMTGTAVNPLLRAVYLAKAGHTVSLVVPWLESPEDQGIVFPSGTQFATREDQAYEINKWAKDQVSNININIRFYEGVYSKDFGSILPLGDITTIFSNDEVKDIVVLEEPEHLTWFHTGKRWTNLFKFCIGVVHTNYIEYAKKYGVFGPQRALFLNFLNKWVCRSYCHRIIKLSDAVQTLPHSITCNVHGVRSKFLDIGKSMSNIEFEKGAYFLGKVLWTKGYSELIEIIENHYNGTDSERLEIDFFGAGPDLNEVKKRCRESSALNHIQIHGIVVDHACDYLQKYKVYVNPSKSDVVCTATAEALAMGKFVICLQHPSNEFFETFHNCLVYENPQQFATLFKFAMENQPKPLSNHDIFRLSWDAATQRFYDAAYVPKLRRGRVDSALALTHKTICSTLVTPPANHAVRARYKRERRLADLSDDHDRDDDTGGDDGSGGSGVGRKVNRSRRSERIPVR